MAKKSNPQPKPRKQERAAHKSYKRRPQEDVTQIAFRIVKESTKGK
jgi:hypothetical protein